MKILLIIITFSIVILQAKETYPKWEDAKQFKYNKFIPPKNYKKNGIKEKINPIEGETIEYYTSGRSPENLARIKKVLPAVYQEYIKSGKKFVRKLRSRKFKIDGKEYRWIGYVEDTAIPWSEDVYFYKNNKDEKPYYKIRRTYYEDGALKDEYGYLNDKSIIAKGWYKNKKLRFTSFEKDGFRYTQRFDGDGVLIQKYWKVHDDYRTEVIQTYKNNILVEEKTTRYDKPFGMWIKYHEKGKLKGKLKWEAYYNGDGYQEFESYCPFETMGYSEQLEMKHKGYFAYRTRNITYCQKIQKDKYFMVTSYDANTHEGETPKYLDVMVSVIDIKNRKILASFYDDKANLDFEEEFSISKFTRRAKINPNVIDVLNEIHVGRWETEILYNSYKVVMDKIIPLAKEKINLKEIEKQAKDGKHFTSDELVGIVNEKPIVEKNITTYNNIGYYLQKHGFHDEALTLFKEILTYFPNRVVLLLNIGDSAWEIKDKEVAKAAYEKYIKLMKTKGKQKKIPKRVYRRLGR